MTVKDNFFSDKKQPMFSTPENEVKEKPTTFLEELKRSKKEQFLYKGMYNGFNDSKKFCPGGATGPSGPGGGSWWWLDEDFRFVCNEEINN